MTGKILIADAVATNRITLKVKLGAACYQVLQAASADEMMALIRREKPRIVVADASFLPGGAEVICDRIRLASPRPALILLASGAGRLEALRSSADEVLVKPVDEQMLLARIRNLLRNASDTPVMTPELAEAATPFSGAPGNIVMIAPDPGTGMQWKHGLAGRFGGALRLADAEQALSEAGAGRVPDLYLIAADIAARADGLRVLSELRSRPSSREAAFVVAVDLAERDIAAVAVDLGAGDVLPLDFAESGLADEAVLRLGRQIARKRVADLRRREAESARLWAMTDPLTGLRNRRYALPAIARMMSDSVASRQMLAVLAIDLDRFKQINDTFGHAAGDSVLQEIGRRIQQIAGTTALAARMGGEEFLVALPCSDGATADQLAEDMRRAIEITPVSLPDTGGAGFVHVTASIGVAVQGVVQGAAQADETALREVLIRADRALFAAKAGGRNRVSAAGSGLAA